MANNFSLLKCLREQTDVQTFDFRRNWWQIMPLLSRRDVQASAVFVIEKLVGCKNKPPYLVDNEDTSQHFERDSLGYYRPRGGCHYMAPFCLTLGGILYPQFIWAILTSDLHSVAVGLEGNRAAIVFDIVSFDLRSGYESVQDATYGDSAIVYSADELIKYWKVAPLNTAEYRVIKQIMTNKAKKSRRYAALNCAFLSMPACVA